MKAYMARLNSGQEHPHELVGIFVASSVKMLTEIIDECTDVDSVEVLRLQEGGIFWGDRVDYYLPHRGDPDQIPNVPGGATFSEGWLPALFDENEFGWMPIAKLAEI